MDNPINQEGALEITDANFAEAIKNTSKPVLIDFFALWCGPCRALEPVIDELAIEKAEDFVIGKLDIDQNPETPIAHNIRSVPTLIIFKNGQEVARMIGSQTKVALIETLKAYTK